MVLISISSFRRTIFEARNLFRNFIIFHDPPRSLSLATHRRVVTHSIYDTLPKMFVGSLINYYLDCLGKPGLCKAEQELLGLLASQNVSEMGFIFVVSSNPTMQGRLVTDNSLLHVLNDDELLRIDLFSCLLLSFCLKKSFAL